MDLVGIAKEQVVQLKALWKNKRALAFQESPVVVVLTGSMEPAIYRGDILFLDNSYDPIRVGETVVFKISDREIPIVHRVIEVHVDKEGKLSLLTKGDNNNIDDRLGGIYARGQRWLDRDSIMGRARIYVPKVGIVTILLNDYPYLKFVVLGVMGIFVLTSKE